MRTYAALTIVTILVAATFAEEPAGEPAWEALWDGETLAGWRTLPGGSWSVAGSEMVGRSVASEKRHGQLITEERFGDFDLRLEFNAITGNSGLYFRVDEVDHLVGVAGFQAEIDPRQHVGGLYETLGRAWVVQPGAEQVATYFRPGEWNRMTVSAHGGHVTVHVNDTLTAELTDDPGRREGHIALQLHGGQDMHVRFRNLEIRRQGAAAPLQRPDGLEPEQQPAQPPRPRPPNVVFLLADDLGFMDVSPNNTATFYETPNLERLAAVGMRFTAAYAACPVCSPTRASILTGKLPARLGTTDYFGAAQPTNARAFRNKPLLPAPYVDHLPLEEVTLAEAFRAAGYATFFAGKWHLGGEGFAPTDQGFDVNVAGNHRGGPYGRGRYFHPFDMPNLDSAEGDHLPQRLAEETCAFIRDHADEPFLAYLSFYSVHTPLIGRPDLVEHFRQKRAELGLEPAWGREGERKVRQVQEHAVYAAMVAAMDEAVGAVLDTLDDLHLADHTIVVFFSDNGGLSTSEGHPTCNLPLRAGKGWLYEGGIREPCLIRAPGLTRPGSLCDAPICSTDFYPTLLSLAGLPPRPDQHADGLDLTPLLTKRGTLPARPLFWHYPHWGNQGGSPSSAIRLGELKLIERFTDGARELFDLATDPGEQHDLAHERPQDVERLHARLESWRQEVGARLPTPKDGTKR